MKSTHRLYLWWKDELCIKCTSPTDDWKFFYDELSEPLIKTGLETRRFQQIPFACRKYCNLIWEKVLNGEKLSWDDKKMFIASFFALYKLNKINSHNFIILKIKSPS